MPRSSKSLKPKTITAEEFDAMCDRGDDITPYLDLKGAVAVYRVNVDFPAWMVKRLDEEARTLNISRQAVIKMWINDRIKAERPSKGRKRG